MTKIASLKNLIPGRPSPSEPLAHVSCHYCCKLSRSYGSGKQWLLLTRAANLSSESSREPRKWRVFCGIWWKRGKVQTCTATVEHGILDGLSWPQARLLCFPQEGLKQWMFNVTWLVIFFPQNDSAVVENETKKLFNLQQKKAPNKQSPLLSLLSKGCGGTGVTHNCAF